MRQYHSESTIRPEEVDATSSPTTTYVHSNIQQKEREDENTGETQTIFTYDVKAFDKKEYEDLQTAEYILELEMELARL